MSGPQAELRKDATGGTGLKRIAKGRDIPGEEPFSAANDDPDGMHEARDVPQQGKQEVDPELRPDAFLKKDTERRKNDGEKNAKEVGRVGGRSHGGVVWL